MIRDSSHARLCVLSAKLLGPKPSSPSISRGRFDFSTQNTQYCPKPLIATVMKKPEAIQLIFDRKNGTIQPKHVDEFFFQMLINGVIEFADIGVDGSATDILARDRDLSNNNFYDRFRHPSFYKGVDLMNITDSTRQYPYDKLLI